MISSGRASIQGGACVRFRIDDEDVSETVLDRLSFRGGTGVCRQRFGDPKASPGTGPELRHDFESCPSCASARLAPPARRKSEPALLLPREADL